MIYRMKLSDLDWNFLKDISPDGLEWWRTDELAGACGVQFQCPRCAQGKEAGEEDGRRFVRGAHSIICWFTGVDPAISPKPGRWNPSGTGIDDLTFVGPGAVSVLLTGPGCGAHFNVVNGEAISAEPADS